MRDLQLQVLVVYIDNTQGRLLTQPQRSGTNMQFASGTPVCPQLIAGGERTVQFGIRPVCCSGGFHGHAAVEEVKSGDAAWGINGRGGRRGR